MNEAVKCARDWGVVGAGGAGFPTAVKLSARADTFLVNAAECEPLLYKDQTILEHFLPAFIKGLALCSASVGASRVVVGVKENHHDLIERLEKDLPSPVEVHLLKDAYPSGDEHVLVFETTGRSVPKGGIPIDVGVVVNNVETVFNMGLGGPVTSKFLTVAGAVDEAVTLRAPLGVPLRAVLKAVNAPTEEMAFIVNGPMMGNIVEDLSLPVTKTTSGILVLPRNHSLVAKKKRTKRSVHKIAYSCDQCVRCSDLCPRDLLGHFVKPHKAMISITLGEASPWQETALYCSECGLCTLYSCPEDLDPFRVMVESKRALMAGGARPKKEDVEVTGHFEYRRTPTGLLKRRLDLVRFERPHRYVERRIKAKSLNIPLKQHTGATSKAVVKRGDNVKADQLIADIPDGALGAKLFAPKNGRVSAVGPESITLEVL